MNGVGYELIHSSHARLDTFVEHVGRNKILTQPSMLTLSRYLFTLLNYFFCRTFHGFVWAQVHLIQTQCFLKAARRDACLKVKDFLLSPFIFSFSILSELHNAHSRPSSMAAVRWLRTFGSHSVQRVPLLCSFSQENFEFSYFS